jgi:hypothetical protein
VNDVQAIPIGSSPLRPLSTREWFTCIVAMIACDVVTRSIAALDQNPPLNDRLGRDASFPGCS